MRLLIDSTRYAFPREMWHLVAMVLLRIKNTQPEAGLWIDSVTDYTLTGVWAISIGH
jgi:hypothetical protein